jgi:uncharacterized protein YkwD
MAKRDYVAHVSPEGKDVSNRIEQVGYLAWTFGENIAGGSSTAAEVVKGWLDSDGHCANLMNPHFTLIGVGLAFRQGTEYGYYWTQVFASERPWIFQKFPFLNWFLVEI